MAQSLPLSTALSAACTSARELARVVSGIAVIGIAALKSLRMRGREEPRALPAHAEAGDERARARRCAWSFRTSATIASTAASLAGWAQLASGASGATMTAFRSCSAGNTSCPT